MKNSAKDSENAGNQKKRHTPMSEPVGEKSSSAPNIQVDQTLLQQPIEEVVFQRPGVQHETNPLKEAASPGNANGEAKQFSGNGAETGQQKQPGSMFSDPGLQDLPPKEKRNASEALVNQLLNGYGKLHKFVNKRLMIKDRKILKLVGTGELDLRSYVPYEDGDWITIGSMIKEYNEEAKDLLTIDPEWRAEITPPMVRVLEKNGLGLSDEALILTLLVADISFKTQLVIEFKSRTDAVLQFAKEQTERMRGVMVPRPEPPAPGPAPAPAPIQPAPIVPMGEDGTEGIDTGQASSIPIQDAVAGMQGGNTGAMGASVKRQSVPKWGANADKINKRRKHTKKATKRKAA